jgi:fucose permease
VPNNQTKKEKQMLIFWKKHYHRIIAAIAFLQLFFLLGVANNFNALHLIPLSEHLGISRGEYSVAYSTKSLVMMLCTFFSGAVLGRFGYRKTAGVAMLGCAASYFLFAFALNAYPRCFSTALCLAWQAPSAPARRSR